MNNARPDYFQPTTPVNAIIRRDDDGGPIRLRIVDEYGDFVYELEKETFSAPLTAVEVLEVFNNSVPCACLSSCEQRFSSDFYPDLDDLADELQIKQVEGG